MPRLSQILNDEKQKASTFETVSTTFHQQSGKPDLFNGSLRVYKALNDEDMEKFPDEYKKVIATAFQSITSIMPSFAQFIDSTASKDYANCITKADVSVKKDDGTLSVLIKDAPVPFLLYLEKLIGKFRTFIGELPVLDSSKDWHKDETQALYKTEPVITIRTKKTIKPLELSPATDKHPAQVTTINVDEQCGTYSLTHLSGAMTQSNKDTLLKRANALISAIKNAREEANSVNVDSVEVGNNIMDYLIGGIVL
jgi:hypothetical protein